MTPDDQFVTEVSKSLTKRDRTDTLPTISAMCVALAKRVERLEARPVVRYCGVWQDGETYPPGTLITCSGSLWHAERKTSSRPGADATWKMAVKNGSFGKDLRA